MRTIVLAAAAVGLTVALSGCCVFRPQQEKAESLGEMGKVLAGVQASLITLKQSSGEKIGLGVSKVTGTFKVTGVSKVSGELELGIVKPVGSVTAGASSESSRENTIVVEFTPAGPNYEKCKDGKDSAGRSCTTGDIVELPAKPGGNVVMMVPQPKAGLD
jgi:hypothetical protein